MHIKVLQWNIGGAHIRRANDEPTDYDSYTHLDLEYIRGIIDSENPDIVTLQETHARMQDIQAARLSEQLCYTSYINDEYDQSHIDIAQRLGQAIIARRLLTNHRFQLFPNPHYSTVRPDGKVWHSHEKGISTVELELPGDLPLTIQTLHALPLAPFDVTTEDESVRDVHTFMATTFAVDAPHLILTGDFNIDDASVAPYFKSAFEKGLQEIPLTSVTTPKGKRYDHVLYRGMDVIEQHVRKDALTDHYPVITTFELS